MNLNLNEEKKSLFGKYYISKGNPNFILKEEHSKMKRLDLSATVNYVSRDKLVSYGVNIEIQKQHLFYNIEQEDMCPIKRFIVILPRASA